MYSDLKDKVAIVTGAATGIGRETAVAFAREGAKVVIADVNDAKLKETKQLAETEGGEVLVLKTDVSDASQVQQMVERTVDKFGRLDIACNNAGIAGVMKKTADVTPEEWDRLMGINLRGQWLCMKYEIPAMQKSGGGSIINMASILGTVGFAEAAVYTASKHGLVGLTKVAAQEYSAENIRINAIGPGFIDTPMLQDAGITTEPETQQAVVAMHPIGRLGRPAEIADAVLWLASEHSSFVTGHLLLADGGYTSR